MSERIEVGDLVICVRAHLPCAESAIGMVFIVQKLNPRGSRCDVCGETHNGEISAHWAPHYALPLSWLRKIPPLTESERTTEEATA